MRYLLLALFVAAMLMISFGRVSMGNNGKKPPKQRPIEAVQQTYGDDIIGLNGVTGHGIGQKGKKKTLVILVKDAVAEQYLDNLLSDKIEGYQVVFKVTGPIKALGDPRNE